jgi:DNA polymerase III subunit gamma/tau
MPPASFGPPTGEAARAARASSTVPLPRDPVARGVEAPAQVSVQVPMQAPLFARFEHLIAFAGDKRDLQLKTALERDVRLVQFEDGRLEIALEPSASRTLIGDLARRLAALTGRRWMVAVSAATGQPTVQAQTEARQEEFKRGVQADPLVQNVLARFPGAQIVAVRQPEPDLQQPLPAEEDEEPAPPVDDDGSAFGAYGRPDDVDDR